jgi:hypothetical protein
MNLFPVTKASIAEGKIHLQTRIGKLTSAQGPVNKSRNCARRHTRFGLAIPDDCIEALMRTSSERDFLSLWSALG